MASLKVEICLKKKNSPRAQIFSYFRYECRNNKIFLLEVSTENLLTCRDDILTYFVFIFCPKVYSFHIRQTALFQFPSSKYRVLFVLRVITAKCVMLRCKV